ncbi:hypothetical protein BGZ74_000840 [Mortierella antarctica]|nr:hypothetical protein BGZ74_000840 [Mortierella antarctica]
MTAIADSFVHSYQLLTLQELDLTNCQITSAMVQHVLMSCSGLTHLYAPWLSASDVYEAQRQLKQGGSTWVCRGLQRFGVRIMEAQGSYVPSMAVFRKLAQLTELVVLRVGSETNWDDRGLRMNTSMGLKYLRVLGSLSSSSQMSGVAGAWVMQRLKVLGVSNMGQVMSEDDVEWIVQQFGGKLTEVRGDLHKNTQKDKTLKKMFPNGILCCSARHSFQYML